MKRRSSIKKQRAIKSQSPALLGSMSPYQVILKPLITEKALKSIDELNTYQFCVHQGANKNDVKKSIASIYGVTPASVRVMNVPYKGRMQRKLVRRAYKKAIVSLHPGDQIELVA